MVRGLHIVEDWTGGMFVLWPALKFSTVAVFSRAGQCRDRKSGVLGRRDIPAFVGNGCMESVCVISVGIAIQQDVVMD